MVTPHERGSMMLDKKTMLYLRVEHEPKPSMSKELRGKCQVIQKLLDLLEEREQAIEEDHADLGGLWGIPDQ